MDEEKKQIGFGKFVVPVVAVSIFFLALFAAGYAYFAASINTNENVTNISTTLPSSTTSLSTTSSNCVIQVTPGSMAQSQNSSTNAVNTTSCALNVTLNGSAGVKCSYDVVLEETSTNLYSITTTTGDVPYSGFEFTGTLAVTADSANVSKVNVADTDTIEGNETQMDVLVDTLNTGTCYATDGSVVFATSSAECTTANATNIWTAYSADGLLAKGFIEVATTGTAVTQTYTLTEKWYNIPIDQEKHSGETYTYNLKAANIVC